MAGMFDLARRGGFGGGTTREFLIQILAENLASGPINQTGRDLQKLGKQWESASLKAFGQYMIWSRIGRGMTTVGDQIIGVAVGIGKMAADFDYRMRLVRTQTNLTDKQFQYLVSHTLTIAGKVPQAASDISQGLYDIFSSTDVNYKQALSMVEGFAKAATAGGTTITTVNRSIIAEMNAYQLPTKATTHLLDLQFQMVRYGVGTYEDFAAALGSMLPAGRSMGQTLETLSGAAAYMSRNGFTAAQSTISVARALDQLVRHRQDIKDTLGVDIVDKATGRYKQLGQIIGDMSAKMKGMSGPQREAVFKNIFGAGEIRAMRFFRVAIPNVKALQGMIDHMDESKGALGRAFGDVETSPLVRFRIEMNKLREEAIKLAMDFLPYVNKFLDAVGKISGWLDRINPVWRNVVAGALLFAGVLLAISGRIVSLMALFKGLQSLMGLATLSFAEAIGPVLLVIGAVTALILIGYELIKHWSAVTAWWKRNWHIIKQVLIIAAAAIIPILTIKFVAAILTFVKWVKMLAYVWSLVLRGMMVNFMEFVASNWILLLITAIAMLVVWIILNWTKVKKFLSATWKFIRETAVTIWQAIYRFFDSTIGKIILAIVAPWVLVGMWLFRHWNMIKRFAQDIWNVIVRVFHRVLLPLYHFFQQIWSAIYTVVKDYLTITWDIIFMALKVLQVAWTIAWDIISFTFKLAWQIIRIAWYAVGYPVFLIIMTVLQILWKIWIFVWQHVIVPTFRQAWHLMESIWRTIGRPIFNFIVRVIKDLYQVWIRIWHLINRAWRDFWGLLKWVWTNIGKPFIDGITKVWNTVKRTWGNIWDDIKGAWQAFWNALERIAASVINGILTGIEAFVNFFIKALNWIRTKFGLSAIAPIHIGRVSWGTSGGGGGGTAGVGSGGGKRALAKGTKNWRGGWAWVGEEGPELMHVPGGSTVIPHTLSKQLTKLPGFAGGLLGAASHFVSSIGNLGSKFFGMLGHGMGAAAGWLANKALNIFHVNAPHIGNLVMTGAEVFKSVKDELVTWVKSQVKNVGSFLAGSGGAGAWGGYKNGMIPLSALVQVAPGMYLAPAAAAAFLGAEGKAGHIGLVGAYRSMAGQLAAARSKGIYGHGGLAAVPGTSRHGWGKAIDVASGYISKFSQVAGQFGWRGDVAGEPWHFDWYGNGGWIREPVLGVGVRSGKGYGLAEHGPEYVGPKGGDTFHFYEVHPTPERIIRELNFYRRSRSGGW